VPAESDPLTLFLAGDVMLGRGIDQVLRHPSDPALREPHVRDARAYVELARRAHGPVPAPVEPSYVWGDGLELLERERPSASIVNLETAVTLSDDFWPGKRIHYRMHPSNVECLRVASIDACALANNHVLDFGAAGLLETLDTLRRAGIATAGAGRDLAEACLPARLELAGGTGLVLLSLGSETSGIPRLWAAGPGRPGVDLLADLSPATAARVAERVAASAASDELVVASIHWGTNWGWEVPPEQVAFAHALIDGGVDVVHGHSSHHVRPVEVYGGRLILYGCGDLVTDYEGIPGYEDWRGDLGALYLPTLGRDGTLVSLRAFCMRMERFRLTRVGRDDEEWLRATLNRIGRPFGSAFAREEDGALVLRAVAEGAGRPRTRGARPATSRAGVRRPRRCPRSPARDEER